MFTSRFCYHDVNAIVTPCTTIATTVTIVAVEYKTMSSVLVAKKKKVRAKWDTEVERKLIDIWADILDEYNGRMITRKKREAIATTQLNLYILKNSLTEKTNT